MMRIIRNFFVQEIRVNKNSGSKITSNKLLRSMRPSEIKPSIKMPILI